MGDHGDTARVTVRGSASLKPSLTPSSQCTLAEWILLEVNTLRRAFTHWAPERKVHPSRVLTLEALSDVWELPHLSVREQILPPPPRSSGESGQRRHGTVLRHLSGAAPW